MALAMIDIEKLSENELQRDLHFRTLSMCRYAADGDLIGNPLIAVSKHDELEYVVNPEFREFKLEASKEMEYRLNEILELSKYCMTRKDKFSKYDLFSIYSSLTKAQESALSYAYYRQAEEFTKLLYKEFEVVPVDEILQKIVKGYATRQIMRGVDCSKDVERVNNDIENKEYGLMQQLKNRYIQESVKRVYYENAVVHITQPEKKWYGTKYVAKAYGMDAYKKAVKEQSNLIKSVATM